MPFRASANFVLIFGLACSDLRLDEHDVCVPAGPEVELADGGSASAGSALAQDDLGPVEPNDDSAAPEPAQVVSDDYVESVRIEQHRRVQTLLIVTWTQAVSAEQTWLEFSFEGSEVMRSHPQTGALGSHREVVLGVPPETDVLVRIVASDDGTEYTSSAYREATGTLPLGLPRPTVFSHDPRQTSPERWLFGSVEDSTGGATNYYFSTFWLYIMDRQGRIVWYYADPSSNATSSFQRLARDGEYIWIEKRAFNGSTAQSVVKTTLDGEYFEEIAVPGLSDAIDVTDDGGLLYDQRGALRELGSDGEDRAIWSCREHFGSDFNCYSNTVNWSEPGDSVLLSFPYENTVVEVERQSGRMIGQYGSAPGSYEFAAPISSPPKRWSFSFQHFPNSTQEGTLLLSSHLPGCGQQQEPGPYQHAFVEFETDHAARTLRETWRYTAGLEWAAAKGMAIRLSNGNTLGNYGTGGVIREVTPQGQTVFGVKFDRLEGDDYYNKMVGHNVLIDDLYALNGGPRSSE